MRSGTVRLDLQFSLSPGKLELGLLLGEVCIGLLYLEQVFHDLGLGHLQVTVSWPLDITLRVDPQGMCLCRGFRRFAFSFTCLSSPI
jgi:hypothetical protein